MYRFFSLLLITLFLVSKTFGQLTPEDQKLLDSLIQHDDFFKMIDKLGEKESYFRINLAAGNRQFSSYNKAIQSLDLNNKLVLTPSLGYYHKSGFGITTAAYVLADGGSMDLYQYALSPGYSYSSGKKFNAALSYIHYFRNDIYNSSSSPIGDEIYSSILFKKGFIKPGFSIGYSTGHYKEIVKLDTVLYILNRTVFVRVRDSAATKLSSLSYSASVEHDFIFYRLLSKNDGLRFTPQLSLISGVNDYSVTHHTSTNLYNISTREKLRSFRRFQSSQENGKFEIQSLGLDLDVIYSFGKFYLEPEVYLDYYLPSTTGNRLTSVYNINAGITF